MGKGASYFRVLSALPRCWMKNHVHLRQMGEPPFVPTGVSLELLPSFSPLRAPDAIGKCANLQAKHRSFTLCAGARTTNDTQRLREAMLEPGSERRIGGSAWESNPAPPRWRGATDFEDREGHRAPFASGSPSASEDAGVYTGRVQSYDVVSLVANYQIRDDLSVGIDVNNLLDDEHYEIFGGDLLTRVALAHLSYSW